MSMTYTELKAYLSLHDVNLDWGMLMVLELDAFNGLLKEAFATRPRTHKVASEYSSILATSDNETVVFQGVRFGAPSLSVEAAGLGGGDAVLRFSLVAGSYRVTGTSNGIEYFIEQVQFAEGQGYDLELRASLASLRLEVDLQGQVQWHWPSTYSVHTRLGTVEATRKKIAAALEAHLHGQAGPGVLRTHTLGLPAQGVLSPRRFYLAISPSENGGDRYAVNLFGSSAQLSESGIAMHSPPFLLPDTDPDGAGFYDAAIYIAPVLGELLRNPGEEPAPPYREHELVPLLSVLGGKPCMKIDHWLRPGEAQNVVAFGQPRSADVPPPSVLTPVVAPQWALRRIGTATDRLTEPHAGLLGTDSVALTAHGLGSAVKWALSANAPGKLTVQGMAAQYVIPDDLAPGYYQVRITASDSEGRQAFAMIVLTPAGYTLALTPPVAGIEMDGYARLTAERPVSAAYVVNDVGNVTVDDHSLEYQAPAQGEHTQALVVATGVMSKGFAIVDLTPPALNTPRWSRLQKFTLECTQNGQPNDRFSDRQYANGRQPVEIRITIQTAGVTDGYGNITYYPLTEDELSSLRLRVRNGSDVEFLDPGEDVISDGDSRMFATTLVRNRYDFMSSSVSRATGSVPMNDPEDGTTVRTLYLLAQLDPAGSGVGAVQFVANFKDYADIWHESSPDTDGCVTITTVEPPNETSGVYTLSRQRPPGAEFPASCTVYEGDMEDPFGQCLTSLDYWQLSYRPRSDALEVLFLDCTFEVEEHLRTAQLSLLRWESELMEETYCTYTGYTFRPRLLPGETDDQQWKTLTYDPWLHWLARLRGHPLSPSLEPNQDPTPGHLWLALYRVNKFPFWFDNEAEFESDPHPLKTFTARFGTVDWDTWTSTPRPLRVSLIDQSGNRHRLEIGFQTDTRNTLKVTTRGEASMRQATTRLHSNAFNFLSFLDTGVDPRTGLYTVATALPELKANALAGPVLPLKLSYNPIDTRNRGFGLGWDLSLTRFEPDGNRMLTLYTGQQFKVTGSGGTPALEERKLETFHFHEDDSQHWRVVHLDGLVEYLQLMDSADGRVALPVRLVAPSGHSVSLEYEPFRGYPTLTSVADDSRELLRIERSNDLISVRFYPSGDQEVATFDLTLDADEQVSRLALPVPEKAAWEFAYASRNGYRYIEQVTTPAGARERMSYEDSGHRFPTTAGRANLPRVTQHLLEPGQGQPAITTRYSYQIEVEGQLRDNNFLGGGQGSIPWADDGLDNLYKADKAYQYGTEQALMVDDQAVRTTKRVFNAFHLLTLEETTQNGHTQRSETQYHLEEGKDFRDQPANCQLVKQATTRWSGAAGTRTERVLTDYDHHGNLLVETAATGVITRHQYYPAEGDGEDCPADPHGFTRQRKQTTVTPADGGEGKAPVRVHRFFYRALPALADSAEPAWPVQAREEKSLDGHETTPYQVIENHWYQDAQEPLTLGRLEKQIATFHDLKTTTGLASASLRVDEAPTTTTRFDYVLEGSAWLPQSVLKTTSTFIGFDKTSRAVNEEHSVLTGQVLLQRDDNDVEVRYHYDALQRLTEEILAPGTVDEAFRRYRYGLAAEGEPAWQVEEDVQGVQFTTYTDGIGRVVEERRAEPGAAQAPHTGQRRSADGLQIYTARYNALGQKAQETVYDDCQPEDVEDGWQPLALTTSLEYDDWGQERVQIGPDNVRRVSEACPIGDGIAPTVKEWQEVEAGERASALITTVKNLFGDPVSVHREGDDGVNDTTTYGYDGLGRKVRETTPWGRSQRETLIELDVYDRETARELPDGARVERQYAVHSDDDLPVEIAVDGKVLGTQTFDGLGRMIASNTGGRERTMIYEASATRPRTVITPRQHTIEYEYQLRLGEEPIRRRSNTEEIYHYDKHTARLMACEKDAVEVMNRTYFTNGRLKTEQRSLDGTTYAMQYRYSVGERLLRYTDVAQATQRYTYDSAGRLSKSEVGAESGLRFEPELTCTLDYDLLGRPHTVRTVDHPNTGAYLATSLTYDSLGREVERRFDIDGTVSVLSQRYDSADCIVQRTLREGDETLRDELFEYDPRGHLTWYECSGPECPIDPYGKRISSQLFELDALDNHTYVTTSWSDEATEQLRKFHRQLRAGTVHISNLRRHVTASGSNFAQYLYEKADPAQLSAIENDHQPDYPARIDLQYDADGNLVLDDAGRTLEYDLLGRLVNVGGLDGEPSATYQYDPSDIISGRKAEGTTEHRFYQEGQLVTLVEGDKHIGIVRAADHLIAERKSELALRDSSAIQHAAGEQP